MHDLSSRTCFVNNSNGESIHICNLSGVNLNTAVAIRGKKLYTYIIYALEVYPCSTR